MLNWYSKTNLLIRILVGLVAGAVAGQVFGPKIAWVSPFGDIFVRVLKMIVLPVVLFTLVVGRPVSIPRDWDGWGSRPRFSI